MSHWSLYYQFMPTSSWSVLCVRGRSHVTVLPFLIWRYIDVDTSSWTIHRVVCHSSSCHHKVYDVSAFYLSCLTSGAHVTLVTWLLVYMFILPSSPSYPFCPESCKPTRAPHPHCYTSIYPLCCRHAAIPNVYASSGICMHTQDYGFELNAIFLLSTKQRSHYRVWGYTQVCKVQCLSFC